MKKVTWIALIVLMIAVAVGMAACTPVDDNQTPDPDVTQKAFDDYPDYYTEDGRVNIDGEYFDIDEYLDSYSKVMRADTYRDYATVDFDLDYHVELQDQGMRWAYWDEQSQTVKEVSNHDREGVDRLIEQGVISQDKPTVVFIHGVQMASYSGTIYFMAEPDCLDPNDDSLAAYVDANGLVQLNRIFLKNGYNVINFQYNRFADEGALTAPVYDSERNPVLNEDGSVLEVGYVANQLIEGKIWTTDSPAGMRYRMQSGLFNTGCDMTGTAVQDAARYDDPDHAIDFSLAEYMAAEWIRVVQYTLSKGIDLSVAGVRFTGHSMGCAMTMAGTYLLTELVRVGQIDSRYLPERICLQDGYLGYYFGDCLDVNDRSLATIGKLILTTLNSTCSWSDEVITRGGTSPLYAYAARQIADCGIACEFYYDANTFSFVSTISGCMRTLVFSKMAVVGFLGTYSNTHNAVRAIYCAGMLCDVPDLVDENGNVIGKALSAASSTQDVLDRMGTTYMMVGGKNTGVVSDDTFRVLRVYDEDCFNRQD